MSSNNGTSKSSSEKLNPVPSSLTHRTILELPWEIIVRVAECVAELSYSGVFLYKYTDEGECIEHNDLNKFRVSPYLLLLRLTCKAFDIAATTAIVDRIKGPGIYTHLGKTLEEHKRFLTISQNPNFAVHIKGLIIPFTKYDLVNRGWAEYSKQDFRAEIKDGTPATQSIFLWTDFLDYRRSLAALQNLKMLCHSLRKPEGFHSLAMAISKLSNLKYVHLQAVQSLRDRGVNMGKDFSEYFEKLGFTADLDMIRQVVNGILTMVMTPRVTNVIWSEETTPLVLFRPSHSIEFFQMLRNITSFTLTITPKHNGPADGILSAALESMINLTEFTLDQLRNPRYEPIPRSTLLEDQHWRHLKVLRMIRCGFELGRLERFFSDHRQLTTVQLLDCVPQPSDGWPTLVRHIKRVLADSSKVEILARMNDAVIELLGAYCERHPEEPDFADFRPYFQE